MPGDFVGFAVSSDRRYVVANYFPAGNQREGFGKNVPAGRAGTIDDIGEAAASVLCNNWMTGAISWPSRTIWICSTLPAVMFLLFVLYPMVTKVAFDGLCVRRRGPTDS